MGTDPYLGTSFTVKEHLLLNELFLECDRHNQKKHIYRLIYDFIQNRSKTPESRVLTCIKWALQPHPKEWCCYRYG